MWRRQSDRAVDTVDCIACGASPPRDDAREYDKQGDRWSRRDKEFEYLCKSCHGELTHQPRRGLEATLVTVGSSGQDAAEFVARYFRESERDESDQ